MRSTQTAPKQNPRTGLWGCVFDTHTTRNGVETLMSTLETPALWATAEEATASGARALSYLEHTGMWPNMCERW